MTELLADGYKLRLMVYNEWKQKFSPDEAIKNINKKSKIGIVSSAKVKYYYKRFNKGKIQIFGHNSKEFVFSSQQETSKNLIDSFLAITDGNSREANILTDNGRFLFSCVYNHNIEESHIIAYDLFYGKKRSNQLSFNVFGSNITIFGEYLLLVRRPEVENLCKLHIFKINYDDLTLKLLKTISLDFDPRYVEILPDQLDNKKFMICDGDKTLIGQIQNDDICVKNVENVDTFDEFSCGKRLVGNLVQGFDGFKRNSVEFCEFNLDTKEETKIGARIGLYDKGVITMGEFTKAYTWSNNFFYGFYELVRDNYLLMFDLLTFKWTDLKIWAKKPQSLSIDENDVLTFCIGNNKGSCASYRVASKKPDKLVNLTLLTALREENLYGNKKYMDAARNSTLQLKFT